MASEHGYPVPGYQQYTAAEVMKELHFPEKDWETDRQFEVTKELHFSEKDWETDRQSGTFDYVIIGSSFCALGFLSRALENNPRARILVVDRGEYFQPDHVQNLHHTYKSAGVVSETFPWSVTDETHNGEHIKWNHGVNHFFGGRSSFWSGWSPEPTVEEMEGWPTEVKDNLKTYFPLAKKLLNIYPVDEISKFDCEKVREEGDKAPVSGPLQRVIHEQLETASSNVPSLYRVDHTPLAVTTSKLVQWDHQRINSYIIAPLPPLHVIYIRRAIYMHGYIIYKRGSVSSGLSIALPICMTHGPVSMGIYVPLI
ncbi:MAG: hypothetical protein A6F71_10615 [Cycloclasticus sp. symbiont of Poecilosclerida sp. M]|nr:MAG: hypothetical protein A6F71_10615 [Cycloclasticus sp. symbiont of Poecilosclerida sp. M]